MLAQRYLASHSLALLSRFRNFGERITLRTTVMRDVANTIHQGRLSFICLHEDMSSEPPQRTSTLSAQEMSGHVGQCRQDTSSNSVLETLSEGHSVDIRGICGHFMDISWTFHGHFMDIWGMFELCSMSGQIGMSTRISVICPVRGHVADISRTNGWDEF
jgi:hypothetical protein